MFTNCLQTDGRTDGRTLSDHNSSPRAIAQSIVVCQFAHRRFKAKDVIRTNVLTNFLSEHPGGHVCQQTGYIFVHIQNVIKTNILTKKNDPPPDIIGAILVTKFHEDQTINVASKVLTRKNAPPPGCHAFQATGIIFKLIKDIIGTNLTKFHDDWTINVAPSVLTTKNAPPPWWPYIIRTNLMTKFYEDRAINVASRVLTSKNAPPPGGHVFKATGTILELVQDIIGTNLLTMFHDDWTIYMASREKCPAPGGHVFQPTGIIFELVQDIIGKNILTKFHEDWK
ncbi:hypothetical protein DPMN_073352 [Dreissena polymorpha]|uniref:Uncharacterized protein n=1 Tax=Dreissena polymorpha TaxID=45954 RepID=A0A9D4BZ00_DREPO|nr:hypothetical protein DPMN_073352 [Dreissena polymorpha]